MIEEREMMKREQLMVQQEIFLQQHWDLTDTTGEARPLGVTPGRYGARHRQPAPSEVGAADGQTGTVSVGKGAEVPSVPVGATPVVPKVNVEVACHADSEQSKLTLQLFLRLFFGGEGIPRLEERY